MPKTVGMVHDKNAGHDSVASPSHYFPTVLGGHECIEFTRRMSFTVGNGFKYVARHEGKNGFEDLRKAVTFLQDASEHYAPAGLTAEDQYIIEGMYKRDIHPHLAEHARVFQALGLIISGSYGYAGMIITSYLNEHGEM